MTISRGCSSASSRSRQNAQSSCSAASASGRRGRRRPGPDSSVSPRRSRRSRRTRPRRARASGGASGRRARATAAAPRPRRCPAPGRRDTRAARRPARARAATRAGSRPRRRRGSGRVSRWSEAIATGTIGFLKRWTTLFSFPNPVNETSARLVAGVGRGARACSTIAFQQGWLLPVLAYGFVARVLTGPTLSPLGLLATRSVTPRLPRAPPLLAGAGEAVRAGDRRRCSP